MSETKICQGCNRELPNTNEHFRRWKNGRGKTCRECTRYQTRTPDNPYILSEAENGEAAKRCRACNRNIPITGYRKNIGAKDGLVGICNDCSYIEHDILGNPHFVIQEGPPLQRAYYEEKIVNGARVVVREVR